MLWICCRPLIWYGLVVVVVVVVVTSPSGNANIGGQMPWRDEEFLMILTVDESRVSTLLVVFVESGGITWRRLSLPTADRRCWLLSNGDDGCRHALANCQLFSDVDEGCSGLDVVVGKLAPCRYVSYQYRNQGASTERREQFLEAECQPNPTNCVKALKDLYHATCCGFVVQLVVQHFAQQSATNLGKWSLGLNHCLECISSSNTQSFQPLQTSVCHTRKYRVAVYCWWLSGARSATRAGRSAPRRSCRNLCHKVLASVLTTFQTRTSALGVATGFLMTANSATAASLPTTRLADVLE